MDGDIHANLGGNHESLVPLGREFFNFRFLSGNGSLVLFHVFQKEEFV